MGSHWGPWGPKYINTYSPSVLGPYSLLVAHPYKRDAPIFWCHFSMNFPLGPLGESGGVEPLQEVRSRQIFRQPWRVELGSQEGPYAAVMPADRASPKPTDMEARWEAKFTVLGPMGPMGSPWGPMGPMGTQIWEFCFPPGLGLFL